MLLVADGGYFAFWEKLEEKMNHKVKVGLMVVLGILGVLIIEKKTGIFTKVFGKIPGVNTLI